MPFVMTSSLNACSAPVLKKRYLIQRLLLVDAPEKAGA
jgi:hypothetical protein